MEFKYWLKKIPFSYTWMIQNLISRDINTILDLGCGDGYFMRIISQGNKWEITGVELYSKYFSKLEKTGIYKKIVKADISKLPRNISNNRYDLIFCSQVVEHLNKVKASNAIKRWEKLAKKRVIITTINGFIPYNRLEENSDENNPLQKHVSGWSISDFASRGYNVRGQGIKFIYGRKKIFKYSPKLFVFAQFIGFVLAPIVYYFPSLATYIIAYKDVK